MVAVRQSTQSMSAEIGSAIGRKASLVCVCFFDPGVFSLPLVKLHASGTAHRDLEIRGQRAAICNPLGDVCHVPPMTYRFPLVAQSRHRDV
jgi:hypothetical protein